MAVVKILFIKVELVMQVHILFDDFKVYLNIRSFFLG